MLNFRYTKKLLQKKNEILNFFSEISPNFYFNFLNNNQYVGKMSIGTREQWFGCHCRVQFFTENKDKSFKKYENATGYYITFNSYSDFRNQKSENGTLSVSLRKDLVDFWAESNVSECSVLFVSSLDDCIYEMPIKNIIDYVIKNKCKVSYNGYDDYIVPICNETVTREAKQNHGEIITSFFDEKYYKPQYISNFTYSVYRKGTCVKVVQFDSTGKYMNEKIFKSISELYDLLTKYKAWDKSKKTLQRHVADEMFLTLNNGLHVFITTDIEKTYENVKFEVIEVIDAYWKNPFFNKDEPEDTSNPKELIAKSHIEIKKTPRKDWEEHFDEIQEVEFYDDEVEMEYRDSLQDAELISVQEQRDAYIQELKDFHHKLAMDIIKEKPHLADYIKKAEDSDEYFKGEKIVQYF